MKLFLLPFFILIHLSSIRAEVFNLASVEVTCHGSDGCETRRQRFTNLKGEFRSLVHLKDTLKLLASDGGYKDISYQLYKTNKDYIIKVNLQIKPVIETIDIGFTDRNIEIDPLNLISLREGDFFDEQRLELDTSGLKSKLESYGFPQSSFDLKVVELNNKVKVGLSITLGKPVLFKKINIQSRSSFIKDYLKRKFNTFYNKPYDKNKFKFYIDEVQRELFSYGYYLIGLDYKPEFKKRRVIVKINVSNDDPFAFEFFNLRQEHRDIIHTLVKDLFRKYKRLLTDSVIKQAIEEHFKKKAVMDYHPKVTVKSIKNKFQEDLTLYRIETKVKRINFLGNTFFTRNNILNFFDAEAFELAKLDYFDEDYLIAFAAILRGKYIEKGFVQSKIIGPVFTFNPTKTEAIVDYIIHEGPQSFIKEVQFEGLPDEFETSIRSKLKNVQGGIFNPSLMSDDIKMVTQTLQEQGFYYAEITNLNDSNFVNYSASGIDVSIKYMINSGPLLRLNRIIYIGNNKTKKRVLEKKLRISKGDMITPSKTKDFESSLSATGLFNTVSVSPIKHHSRTSTATDLMVKVTERDYGLIEFAPGFRTDLGVKLTATASYLNLGGLNRAISMRSQVNQRLNYQTFDPRRRKDKRQLLEHNETLTYNQGDIFDTQINSATGVSYQFKRFYSFDADIFRLNNTFTRDLTSKLSSSIRYQYEAITQTDATEERDNGSFKIGAITPSLTYDLRNSQVNPVKGAFFNMTCEFANPYFLSQKESDLTINYYKLISRNRFYLPYKYGTIAFSMVGGVQENLANERVTRNDVTQTAGYIPNIKVFRLAGMDIVRGFNDEEINRVPGENKDDISQVRVENKAYLANFKVEPRYFINDTMMAGIFYDAGRVFVNQVNLGELRDSVGVTFKFLTPVGTLDFDYGIKLLRERNKDGTLEDPGRFHVSIGFF
jgi:outer membrane protein insertion porin family